MSCRRPVLPTGNQLLAEPSALAGRSLGDTFPGVKTPG
jgi:hypothetical protein